VTSVLLIWTLFSFFPLLSHAASNELVYQGYLTGKNGNPYPQSTVSMTFNIYSSETGVTPLWTETRKSVAVTAGGAFTVVLGSVKPIPDTVLWGDKPSTAKQISNFASEERWLDVYVNGILWGSRLQLSTCSWAANAQTLDGLTSSSFAWVDSKTGTIPDYEVPATVARTDAVDNQISTLQAQIVTLQKTVTSLQNTINAQATIISSLESTVSAIQSDYASWKAIFAGVTRDGNTLTFSRMNLQVVSGSNATYGTTNGLGNLIIGYNERRGDGKDNTTGSHNLVLGTQNNYSSYGGIVTGYWNEIGLCALAGGENNTASGNFSSVLTGVNNTASASGAIVSGGNQNTASGVSSSILGGQYNTASGNYSSVAGGGGTDSNGKPAGNTAFGNLSAILGGQLNWTGDMDRLNPAFGQASTISGGNNNMAYGKWSSVSGGDSNWAAGTSSSISGGSSSQAEGDESSVSGGENNYAGGSYSSVSGGIYNTARGGHSFVSGGQSNMASGAYSSISGGEFNTAAGSYSSVAGGGGTDSYGNPLGNTAFANLSVILGGQLNWTGDPKQSDPATGSASTISGGATNTASGNSSSVSGGNNRQATGEFNWVAGAYHTP
jgi:hypothetical protein